MTVDVSTARVRQAIVHQVGNRGRDEGCRLSSELADADEAVCQLLVSHYLASAVKSAGDGYEFFHESDLQLNEIYHYSRELFDGAAGLQAVSEKIARHLYAQSVHPNIGAGDLLLVLFHDIKVDGETTQALGIFKSEVHEAYLSVEEAQGRYRLRGSTGISLGQIQKGAVVIARDHTVYAVDRLSSKTKYWLEAFLQVRKKVTEKAALQSLTKLVKKVTSEIEEPDRAIEFSNALVTQLESDAPFSIDDIKQLSSDYVPLDALEAALAETHAVEYFSQPEAFEPPPAKKLSSAVQKGSRKIKVMAGVELVFDNNFKVSSIDKDEDTDDDSVIVTLRIGRGRED
ncbi:nucleoid-associated protein [Chitinivorax sp. PXF-14]|uniref:nucleoid-associated protein n=1 Tax=Chitinivorax sp. PXF-14 TaxID=3230488 RepID=UPI0034672BDC